MSDNTEKPCTKNGVVLSFKIIEFRNKCEEKNTKLILMHSWFYILDFVYR